MNIEWINVVIPLGLCLFYGYKIFFKKEKTATNGFSLGFMLILFILSASSLLAKLINH